MMINEVTETITEQEMKELGCYGCEHHKIYPREMVECCHLPASECTRGVE